MGSGEDPASSSTMGMPRKLAAILSADVAGYGRLMGEDEEATIHTLTVYQGVIATLVQQHRGRVVDSPGDNLLAEFASVVDAVQCAVAIQREIHERNTALPLQRRMQFRLGINLGDVLVEGGQIYGDGVNIAARLESLAEAGGISISGTVYDQIATKLALGYEFLGEQTVKNITMPVRVYRIHTESGAPGLRVRPRHRIGTGPWPKVAFGLVGLLLILGGGVASWRLFVHPPLPMAVAPTQKTAALPLPDKPSIAVLPFVNMSGDSAQEYFSDGMTEDLITDLSRLAGLFVIARNSVFTYKGKAVKPEQVRRELGVRYMFEGSVRKANDRVRITAQLVDATTGYHLWAERYDRDLQDIFAVQEEIARRITRAMAVRLTAEEAEHMGQSDTNDVKAWEYFMQGTELYRRFTKEANAQARNLFLQAIDRDRNFARAYASVSATHRQDWLGLWSTDLGHSQQLAHDYAQEAVEKGKARSLPYGHQQLAYYYVYKGDHGKALTAAEEAVKLDPNDADGYAAWTQMLSYDGQPQEAVSKMEYAMRLNPKVPEFYYYHLAVAYYVMKQYDKALENLQKALGINPDFRPARHYLVAVYSEIGLSAKAKAEMAILYDKGSPLAKLLHAGDMQRAEEHIQRITPYKDIKIRDRLREAWKHAAS